MKKRKASDPKLADAADFRQLLDQLQAIIGLRDKDSRYRYVNAGGCQLTGLPAEEIIGRTGSDVGFGIYDIANRPYVESALAGEITSHGDWNRPRKTRPRYVQYDFYPNRGPDGEVDGYWGVARDATELKLIESRHAAMIATALDCIIVIDWKGLVIEFNPAAERTFGYSRAEAIGKPMVELIVPPDLRARHAAGMARYLETDEARLIGRRIEIDAMRADGSVFPVELAIAEIRLPGRRTFSAYLRDLTPAREAQAEIQRQREALLQSEKMAAYGSLLAGVAHELNNPLSIVIGHALMLQEVAAGTPYADRAGKIQQAAERCGRIVKSFLAMARQQEIQARPVKLASVVDDVLTLLAYDLRSHGVETVLDLPTELPVVQGDPDRLHQVLANLVTNARQAMEDAPGPRRITVSARQVADAIELSVADNGPGVPKDIRSRLFDPFFSTKAVGSGTGVGLAVSRGIVESHGGTLTLAESAEPGAQFVVRLPLGEVEGSRAPVDTPAAPDLAAPLITARRRALIVDDEPEVAGLLSEILNTLGFDCTMALNGREGQARMSDQDFDVVLCDMRMPDQDGLAMHRWIAKNRPTLLSRLAFVTGDTLGRGAGGALARLERPILEKPFVPSEVRLLLDRIGPGDRG